MYSFFAYLNRMKYINRWSLMRSTICENIMEHSHQVAVVAHCLAVISNVYFDSKIDIDRVAVIALFHETSEVITGDLPTPIKYFNPEIKQAYKKLELLANDKLLSMLPDAMQEYYEKIIKINEGAEYKLVKYADKLCAYIKCIEEIKVGNNEFKQAKEIIYKDLKNYDSREVDFFVKNFIEAYTKSLDELGGSI